MASYIDATLINNEQVLYRAKVSVWALMPTILAGLVFVFLNLFAIGFVCWIAAFIRYKTTELAFTNKRVIAKAGFIARSTVELDISKVESLQVDQGIVGRICDYGTLIVSGAGNPRVPISHISAPMTFRRSFLAYQDELKSTRELAQPSAGAPAAIPASRAPGS
ncbi:PH domain-containing protein [Orrella sp. JC864]|uniref:PH domain-containing protein n=1 Tax=Orrella sp. JC864 TaxID=3120298 RepID=UPI0012BB84FB